MTNNYDPNQKRGGPANAGNWTKYENSNPEASLPSGDTLTRDESASERATRDAIAGINSQLAALTPEGAGQVSRIYGQINDGMYGDLREVAWTGIRKIESREADTAAADGRDSSDQDDVNPLRGAAERVYSEEFYRRQRDLMPNEHYTAMSAAHDAAVALTYRDQMGKDRFNGFTREAYDHLTRPWRQAFGPLHPDDELEPASWSKRRACVTEADHTVVGVHDDNPHCSDCGQVFPSMTHPRKLYR